MLGSVRGHQEVDTLTYAPPSISVYIAIIVCTARATFANNARRQLPGYAGTFT